MNAESIIRQADQAGDGCIASALQQFFATSPNAQKISDDGVAAEAEAKQ